MAALPKISIVIPSFNKVEFIGSTLQSIIAQKYSNLEVIIRDGGSTDGTQEVIKKYAQKYPKLISWLEKRGEGQKDAINKGLKEVSGEILTYLNADDVYQDGVLREVGEYFAKHPNTLWLAGRGKTIDENGNEIASWVDSYKNYLLKLNNYSWLLCVNYLFQPSVFLSKSAYKNYGPFTGTATGVTEYEMWLRLGKAKMPKILDNVLSGFRLSRGSISTTEFKKILFEDEKIVEKHTSNQVILMLHYLHNLGRIITLNILGIR